MIEDKKDLGEELKKYVESNAISRKNIISAIDKSESWLDKTYAKPKFTPRDIGNLAKSRDLHNFLLDHKLADKARLKKEVRLIKEEGIEFSKTNINERFDTLEENQINIINMLKKLTKN